MPPRQFQKTFATIRGRSDTSDDSFPLAPTANTRIQSAAAPGKIAAYEGIFPEDDFLDCEYYAAVSKMGSPFVMTMVCSW